MVNMFDDSMTFLVNHYNFIFLVFNRKFVFCPLNKHSYFCPVQCILILLSLPKFKTYISWYRGYRKCPNSKEQCAERF
jgi:hypothetical protein